MRKYKLIDGIPIEITYIQLDNGGRVICPNEQQLIDYGCKELIYTEQPTITANQYLAETYSENETQIIIDWVINEVPIIWHEPNCNFQIKFTHKDLISLIDDMPAFVQYRETLTKYEDEFHVYYYVNYFDGMDKEALEFYGAIITAK